MSYSATKEIAKLADEGGVRVRRRDGAALLLVREDRVQAGAGLGIGDISAPHTVQSGSRTVLGLRDHGPSPFGFRYSDAPQELGLRAVRVVRSRRRTPARH